VWSSINSDTNHTSAYIRAANYRANQYTSTDKYTQAHKYPKADKHT
jgi:hypothetical protein